MKNNTLLALASVYLFLVGLGFLLDPSIMVFGALGGTPATIVAELRQYGGALLGIALLDWLARKVSDAGARRAVFMGNALGFTLVALGGILRQLNGAVAVGWLFVAINLVLAVWFWAASAARKSN